MAEKDSLTSFQVRTAPKSWSTYETNAQFSLITEGILYWARIVLRGETTWDLLVLLAFLFFFNSSTFGVLDVLLVLFDAFPTRQNIL